ncbi:uncharacterized protein LODBEIA_P22800 [Lodderomyces beijingensis]|uniref:Cyclin n=1 Tax=Lodderomyces beijingensis TaxID=1775926 RepID=A0ABP0ZME9_9ASCO
MTSTAYVKNIQEIPSLKPPQETFVDAPQSIYEIDLQDLKFDLSHGLKNFNNLHPFHVIYIFTLVLKFTIRLQNVHPHLLQKFRSQQLEKLGINEEELLSSGGSEKKKNKTTKTKQQQKKQSTKMRVLSPNDDEEKDHVVVNGDEGEEELEEEQLESDGSQSMSSSSSDLSKSSDKIMDEVTPSQEESDLEELKYNFEDDGYFPADSSLTSILQDPNIDDIKFKNKNNQSVSPTMETPPYVPMEFLLRDTSASLCLSEPELELELDARTTARFTADLIHAQKSRHPTCNQHYQHLLKVFTLKQVPHCTIEQFLLRINQYSPKISINAYLHSIYMLYRISISTDLVQLNERNCFRLIIAALRTSIKLLDDVYQKQTVFKNVVGCNHASDLLKIELSFLYLVNFNMNLECEDSMLKSFLKRDFIDLCNFVKSELDDAEYRDLVGESEDGDGQA